MGQIVIVTVPPTWMQNTVEIQNLGDEVDVLGPGGSGYDGTIIPLNANQNTVIDSGLWQAWFNLNYQSPLFIYQLSVVPGSQT